MSLVFRLRQQGRVNERTFRIVVTEKSFPRDGKYLESVGYYLPHSGECVVSSERVAYWISNGAHPTEKTLSLFKKYSKEGIANYFKRKKSRKPKGD